jgi:hypothetical protein
MSRLRTLVEDALYGRQMESIGCFATNRAAEELYDSSPEILPVIEEVIRGIVIPRMHSYPLQDSCLEDKLGIQMTREAPPEFVGLLDLIGAYIAISLQHCPAQTLEFLKSLPTNLLRLALTAIELTFGHSDSDDDRFAPSTGILELLENLAHVHDDGIHRAVAGILSSFRGDSDAQAHPPR